MFWRSVRTAKLSSWRAAPLAGLAAAGVVISCCSCPREGTTTLAVRTETQLSIGVRANSDSAFVMEICVSPGDSQRPTVPAGKYQVLCKAGCSVGPCQGIEGCTIAYDHQEDHCLEPGEMTLTVTGSCDSMEVDP